jgi:tRNA synthetases class I (W and Y)
VKKRIVVTRQENRDPPSTSIHHQSVITITAMLALPRRLLHRPRMRRVHQHSFSTNTLPKIIFSGIQPTGIPHVGNYVGALKNWVSLQFSLPPESKIFYSIVDLHAITVPYTPAILRKERDEMWYVLHAVGIDMQRCTVFEQSAVSPSSNRLKGRSLNIRN